MSSNLLEVEMRAEFARERREFDFDLIANIEWISPDGPLTDEIESALQVGCLREADLWHIATALYVARTLGAQLAFMTLDGRQQQVASRLGFVI